MTSKKNILIVEDEPIISHDIANMIVDLGYMVGGMASSTEEALSILESKPIDLILLDIVIEGDDDGIVLAEKVNQKYQIPFVFLTSNADSTTLERAKVTMPAGYIVKPFTINDLKSNCEIALFKASASKTIKTSVKVPEKEDSFVLKDYLFIKENSKLIKLSISDILYAEANDNYTFIYTLDKKYLVSSTLKSIEAKLNKNVFVRIHRSFFINIEKINAINGNVIVINEFEVPIGKTYKSELMERINLI